MFIKIKTDVGQIRIINTDNIAFIDGSEADISKLFLKTHPDFDIRVDIGIHDMFKVLNGDVLFEDVHVDKGLQEFRDSDVKMEKKVEEVVEEPKKELKKEVPTFSKKKKKDNEKKEEKVEEEDDLW